MNTKTQKQEKMASNNSDEELKRLIGLLAKGAKCSNGIPLSNNSSTATTNNNDSDDDDEQEEFDEFGFHWAFPEFHSSICKSRSKVLEILGDCLNSVSGDNMVSEIQEMLDSMDVEFDWDETNEVDDSSGRIWQEAVDVQDELLDEVEEFISGGSLSKKNKMDCEFTTESRRKSYSNKNNFFDGMKDIDKPQDVHSFQHIDNSRTDIWVPPFIEADELPPLENGHGLSYVKNTKNIIAPSMHYPHSFHQIIESFEYLPEQITCPPTTLESKHGIGDTLFKPMDYSKTCKFIDTEQDLQELSNLIKEHNINLIAVDLEHHSYRSFHGFTCLMQISIRLQLSSDDDEKNTTTQTYLVDTIKLRPLIHKYLANNVFGNPSIVKVMHGADSDVKWLQRDFGIYIVNLFDTGMASRVLRKPSKSLAYLLKKYAGVKDIDTMKQKYQTGDWRVRPLEQGMLEYAMGDTHYLLDVYDVLRQELDTQNPSSSDGGEDTSTRVVSIKSVLDNSRKTCLLSYRKEPFYPDGYDDLISGGGKRNNKNNNKRVQSRFTVIQESILKELWSWRDAHARKKDESIQYICHNKALLRIASVMPQTLTILQGIWSPMPVEVMREAQTILKIVKTQQHNNNKNNEKTTSTGSSSSTKGREISALLNNSKKSEEKKQASTKMQHQDNVVFVSEEEDSEMDIDPNKEQLIHIQIHPSNSEFQSFENNTDHSIEMISGNQVPSRSLCVDGLGAIRFALNSDHKKKEKKSGDSCAIQKEVEQARLSAEKVRVNITRVIVTPQLNTIEDEDEDEEVVLDVEELTSKSAPEKKDIDQREVDMIRSVRDTYKNNERKRASEHQQQSPKNDEATKENKKQTKQKKLDQKKKKQKKTKIDVIPYDYSKSGMQGLGDQKSMDNPFFSGAALGLASASNTSSSSSAVNNNATKKSPKKENTMPSTTTPASKKKRVEEKRKRRDHVRTAIYKS